MKNTYINTGVHVLDNILSGGTSGGRVTMLAGEPAKGRSGVRKSYYKEHMKKIGYKHIISPDGVDVFYPNTVTLRFTKDGQIRIEEDCEDQNFENWEEE